MARKIVRKSKGGTTKIKTYQKAGKVSVSKTKKNPKTNEYGWVEGSSIKNKKVSSKRAERMKKRGWTEDKKYQKGGKTRAERVAENLKIKEMKSDSKNKRRVKSASSKAIADNMLKDKKDNRAKRAQETVKAVRTKKKTVNRKGSMKVIGDDVISNKVKTNINSKNKSKSTSTSSGATGGKSSSGSNSASASKAAAAAKAKAKAKATRAKTTKVKSTKKNAVGNIGTTDQSGTSSKKNAVDKPRPKPSRPKAMQKFVKPIVRKQKGGKSGSTSRNIKSQNKKHQISNPGKRKSGKQYRNKAGK